MASLNLSQDGPAINRSYQAIVNASLPTGAAASSPTYGQWAVYSVSAPLLSAFQQDSSKESVLKVQSTGEGELVDLIDEFSDGRIQFAYAKVKDPNTTLPKSVLIAWCGEGVPERTKGYFGSHLSAVSNVLKGYHVQVTARSDNDLTPESIIRKVQDASGSKYSGDTGSSSSGGPPPTAKSKPAFTPTSVGGSAGGFKPLAGRGRTSASQDTNVDEDGWGADAPQTTRTQLEKVGTAYKPTKVNMAELTSQKPEPSRFENSRDESSSARDDVVRGGYQPIGKVDIAAIRRQAQGSSSAADDRPSSIKGAYEPVGKVDIAAIRARAQPSDSGPPPAVSPARIAGSGAAPDAEAEPKSLSDRASAFGQSSSSERMTSMLKPKVANRFGSSASNFSGTRAPAPGGFTSKTIAAAAPIGTASKNFADQGGKTPAQIWAEKKARASGGSGAGEAPRPSSTTTPMVSQASGGGGFDSGYGGKKWSPVATTRTGQSAGSGINQETTGDDAEAEETDNVGSIRDRFKNAAPMGRPTAAGGHDFDDADEEKEEAPPPPMASRPNTGAARGVPLPGLPRRQPVEEEDEYPDEEPSRMPTPPAQPPRSATPPTPPRSDSPIRVARPVGRGRAAEMEAPEERFSPPPMPIQAMSRNIPQDEDIEDEPQIGAQDAARGASLATAATTFGAATGLSSVGAASGGKTAVAQFDYEKAEDNELELREGEKVVNIEMIDEDWWMGENSRGEKGLFPSNYVEIVEGGEEESRTAAVPAPPAAPAAAKRSSGPTATAQFDYEAQEENELSFPDGATITGLEFPDEDWWLGEFGGSKGLFPANYVALDE